MALLFGVKADKLVSEDKKEARPVKHPVTVLPAGRVITAEHGQDLLSALRSAGLGPDAPCGGQGRCGKCTVFVDGKAVISCQTPVQGPMTVTVPDAADEAILTGGIAVQASAGEGYALAFDIGTTTVAGFLLDGTGAELATLAAPNPQRSFGADVISRIRAALDGHMEELTGSIRNCVADMAADLCQKAGVAQGQIRIVSLVGNPAMQQLFLGIHPENLAKLPFAPVLTRAEYCSAGAFVSGLSGAKMLIVPDVSGFVGADTLACVLATTLAEQQEPALLVDIGTNGEMVLTDGKRMVACSAAAGPALEGANIRFGMRAARGAIDHVRAVETGLECSVIGGAEPMGICGSGLIDAVAAALEQRLLDSRGRILSGDTIALADPVYLTQEDIRQVQLAKGAIAAGIELMARHLGLEISQIRRVYLAGAFGSFLSPKSACCIGLLPPILQNRILAVGNAAGSGAKMLALDTDAQARAQALVGRIEFLELATRKDFPRCFAKHMRFAQE